MSEGARDRIGRVLAVVAGFTAVGLFFASRTYVLYNSYPDNRITWGEALRPALVDWYLWALFWPVVAWLVARYPIERERRGRNLAVHLGAGSAVAVARIAMDLRIARPLLGLDPRPFGTALWTSFHPNLMTYAVLVGLAHAIVFHRRYRERELRASQLEARLAQARLDVLRMQLDPHFLFNTLHAIGTLMHRDVAAAERMLTLLSDLLRATIEEPGQHEVPLREEVAFLERYLDIERTRFADRLTVDLEIDPRALDLAVPHLLLQPLVENALRHGIAPRAGPGRVAVTATVEDGRLEVRVADDGRGLRPGWDAREGGVGLPNARARLAEMYGDDHSFEVAPGESGGTVVRLSIPAREPGATGGSG